MQKINLTGYVNHQNKNVFIILLSIIFMICYSGAGYISSQDASFLKMPQFEKDIPFMLWTIWIYIVLYPAYLVWALTGYEDEAQMNKTLYAFIFLTIISCAIFIALPIGYPRHLFPLPLEESITNKIFYMMRAADKPSNCLPSLHVGLCYLFAYGFYHENKKRFWFSILISSLVSLSTLTTKQHYIADIVAGFILATGLFIAFNLFVEIKKIK